MIVGTFALLVVIAGGLTLLNGITGKCPLWVPLLLVCIALLVNVAR